MIPQFTGHIVESYAEHGCGWMERDGQRIFLHWREFAERRKRPESLIDGLAAQSSRIVTAAGATTAGCNRLPAECI